MVIRLLRKGRERMKSSKRLLITMALFLSLILCASKVKAEYTLQHNNSIVNIDPNAGPGMDYAVGMYDWCIDDTDIDHLNSQWFWYRIGNQLREYSLNKLSNPNVTWASPNALSIAYQSDIAKITIDYLLQGGLAGSKSASMLETITIKNISTTDILNIQFFQYNDFDLLNDLNDFDYPNNDSGRIVGSDEIVQYDSAIMLREKILQSIPDYWGISSWYLNSIFDELEDDNIDKLNNTLAILGPTDISFAWQWDFSIPVGESEQIIKSKSINPIPEPSTNMLLSLGFFGLGLLSLVKSKSKSKAKLIKALLNRE